jgi:hypothetical protein
MMVGERVVIYAIVYLAVRVAGSLGAKLPYRPVFAMLRVEELDERVKRVPICALGIGAAWARRGDD